MNGIGIGNAGRQYKRLAARFFLLAAGALKAIATAREFAKNGAHIGLLARGRASAPAEAPVMTTTSGL